MQPPRHPKIDIHSTGTTAFPAHLTKARLTDVLETLSEADLAALPTAVVSQELQRRSGLPRTLTAKEMEALRQDMAESADKIRAELARIRPKPQP